MPFARYIAQHAVIAGLTIVGHLLSCTAGRLWLCPAAGAGPGLALRGVLATMMLPYPVTMVPLYMLFNKLGWINTFLPLIVPAFFGSAFYIFLLRQFFMTIPRELEEAAVHRRRQHAARSCGTSFCRWRCRPWPPSPSSPSRPSGTTSCRR